MRTPYFNSRRLTFARRRRGLSKVQLAEMIGVTVRTVVAYEIGEYPPSPEGLDALSLALQFPSQFFIGSDLETLAAQDVSFRSLTKMTAKQRESALTQAELAVYFCAWLESRFELPIVDVPDFAQDVDPEAAAEAVRQHWGLGQLAIRNMIHLLEQKGIRVFSVSIQSQAVDALSTWKAGIPLVFLNGAKSAERSRFDAAHELGHLVLHRHGSPAGREAEDQAQRFASAFLMPRASVLARSPKLATINELLKLKKVFGVSLAAINYRLHQVGLITDWHYRSLAIQLAKKGFRSNEPGEMERESSFIIPIVLGKLQEDGFSRKMIANELCLPVQELENVLFSQVMVSIQGGKTDLTQTKTPTSLRRVK